MPCRGVAPVAWGVRPLVTRLLVYPTVGDGRLISVDAQTRTVSAPCELPASLACSPGFLLSKIGLYVRTTFGQAMIDQGLRPPHYAVLVFLRQNASPPQTM